ncbi:MAG: threonine--tRNA ligase, partial [Candidatus Magasanikbacteria bacterium]|nr:threonine--tRNA ligase [Candidatus Magasanikbacteria bacterium]
MEKEELDIVRHSAAHLIAAAAESLYPGAKFGVGPIIENGFYYDIDFPTNIGEEDLQKIEEKARELIKGNLKYERKEMPIDEAIKLFESRGQVYKVELLKDLKEK